MADNLEKRSVLVLGTCHVTKETADLLNGKPVSDWPCVGGPYSDYGWFLYAHDENDGTIPPDLFAVMEFARANGCSNVLFDCDAEVVGALPTWDW